MEHDKRWHHWGTCWKAPTRLYWLIWRHFTNLFGAVRGWSRIVLRFVLSFTSVIVISAYSRSHTFSEEKHEERVWAGLCQEVKRVRVSDSELRSLHAVKSRAVPLPFDLADRPRSDSKASSSRNTPCKRCVYVLRLRREFDRSLIY